MAKREISYRRYTRASRVSSKHVSARWGVSFDTVSGDTPQSLDEIRSLVRYCIGEQGRSIGDTEDLVRYSIAEQGRSIGETLGIVRYSIACFRARPDTSPKVSPSRRYSRGRYTDSFSFFMCYFVLFFIYFNNN